MSAHTPVEPDSSSSTAAPRVACEDNTSEKRTKWWKICRKWNPFKRPSQTHETEVCPLEPEQELPHTSSAEPTAEKHSKWSKACACIRRCLTAVKPTRMPKNKVCPLEPTAEKHTKGKKICRKWNPFKHPTQTHETEVCPLEPTAETFHSLYDVGKKINSSRNGRIHWGYRNSDHKLVFIKFVRKRPSDRLVELPGYSRPLSPNAATMIRLQKKYNKHIIQLYDLLLAEDEDVLVLENPCHYVPLFTFLKYDACRVKDYIARIIIRQLIAILKHCMDCGVYPKIHMRDVLIHPETLHVKLVHIRDPLITEGRREDEPVLTTEFIDQTVTDYLCQLLETLVKRIYPMSKKCQVLLRKLRNKQPQITLDAILELDWFKEK